MRSVTRTYSRHSRVAVTLLAGLIRIARKEGKLTVQEVADRAGERIADAKPALSIYEPELPLKAGVLPLNGLRTHLICS